MAWWLLFAAGAVEIIFALSLKYNEGFTRWQPSLISLVSGAGSFYLLTLAIRSMPVSTAYAVWTGMGAVGVAIAGIVLFNESADWLRVISIGFVIVGIVGLKLSDTF